MRDFILWLERGPYAPFNSDDIQDSMGESVLIRALGDKPNEKSLYYSLKQDERGWFGAVYSCKSGTSDYWFTKADKTWTREEKKQWDERREAIRKEQEDKKKQGHDRVSAECLERFVSLPQAIDHPYAQSKGITIPSKVKIDGDKLVIAGIDFNNKIWTVQEIDGDGVKKFTYGGKKEGTFFPIGLTKDDKPRIIHICEGFATGCTLFEAVSLPVLVAWDAGNLRAVAKAAREKYPETKIVICADNDQWTIRNPRPKPLIDIKASDIDGDDARWDTWRKQGYCENKGMKEAQQAAALCDGWVVHPEFNGLDPRKPTDFNDGHKIYGIESIKNRLSGVSSSPVSVPAVVVAHDSLMQYAPAAGDEIIGLDDDEGMYGMPEQSTPKLKKRSDGNPDWFTLIRWTTEPDPKKPLENMMAIADLHDGKSMNNLITFIRYHWKGLFVLNEFSDEIIVRTRPPWMSEKEKFTVHTITDSDKINMAACLEWYGFSVSDKTVEKAIISISEKDKIHPVRNYFEGYTDPYGEKHAGLWEKWDGVERLDDWLINYVGCTTQDERYVRTVGAKWLIAAVARIFNAGCKFDHMLVIEGKTDIGKSWLLRELATFGKEAYFLDDVRLSHLESDKHAAMRWQGKLIIEVAELAGLNKVSVETVKAWITRQEDEYIPKFSNERKVRPRQFVLAGTTNEDVWLTDTTGNKRFWPVKGTHINKEAFLADKEQLWAEAIVRFKAGEKYWLEDTDPIYEHVKYEQSARLMGDSWEDMCRVKLSHGNYYTMTDVYEYIGVPVTQRNRDSDKRVRDIMRSLGFIWKQAYSVTKHKQCVWVKS